jgi:hypothetical protein
MPPATAQYRRYRGRVLLRRLQSGNSWARNVKVLGIRQAACAFANVTPESYDTSERAQAIAVDLLSQVSNGWLGTPEDYSAKAGKTWVMIKGTPAFPPKGKVSIDMIVDKRGLAEFGKDRGLDTSWLE